MRLGLTWGEVARAVGGRLSRGRPEAPFDAVSTDTRTLAEGAAFVALKGERHDAHDHLGQAGRASGWIVEAGRWQAFGAPDCVLEVADTLQALQRLAAHHRRRFDIPVVAVTGSNGKTTTKEMLRAVLGRRGAVCATRGNLNNHIGVPLSLLKLAAEHRFAVFELGANHVGEIAVLTRLAAPTLAIVTNVSEAHIGLFGSLERIFEAKSELPRNMDGPVVLNLDDPYLRRLLPELGSRVVGFGSPEGAKARYGLHGPSLVLDGRSVALTGASAEPVNVPNAAAAAAAAAALGLGPEDVRRGLAEDFEPAPMRLERRRLSGGARLLLDAYNANPGSMRASISAFVAENEGRRRTLVLGDMKELGAESAALHRELGRWLKALPLERVLLAGPEMKEAAKALQGASFAWRHAEDPLELASELPALGPGDALFVKGSRAMALERIVEGL